MTHALGTGVLAVVATLSGVPLGCQGGPAASQPDGGGGGRSGASGSLPLCDGAPDQFSDYQANGTPAAILLKGTGTSVFSLDRQTAGGWEVSLVSGDLPPPALLVDGGLLSDLTAGDRLEVVSREECRPYSGCKSWSVIRNGANGGLISAAFHDDPAGLPTFSTLVGISLALRPECTFPRRSLCFLDELQTHHRLLVSADEQVLVARDGQAPFTVGGHPLTVSVNGASTIHGGAPVPHGSSACIDSNAFWSAGGLGITIVRR